MQSRMELEQEINEVIGQLEECADLFSDIHPKLEKFSQRAVDTINAHIDDMYVLIELLRDENLDIKDPETNLLVEEAFCAAVKVISEALDLAQTLMECTLKLKEEFSA